MATSLNKYVTLSLPESVESRNYFHLVIEIAWFAIAAASTARFLQFYAIRLGANAFDLGLLASMPSIVLVFSVTFSRWWRNRNPDSVRALMLPGAVFRMTFLIPFLAPFFPQHLQVPWLIFGSVLPATGQGMASAIFLVMMRETVSSNHMTSLMARRQLALNIMLILGSIFFGLMLERIAFPLNYQIMFALSFVLAMVSQWHLAQLKTLTHETSVKPVRPARPLRETLSRKSFQSICYVTTITYITFFSIIALIPLHLKQDLGATEGFMAIFGVVELIAGALVTLVLRRMIEQLGSRMAAVIGMVGASFAALALALAPNLTVSLIGAALTGASWTLTSVAVLHFFTENTEPDDMGASTLYHQFAFGAMFVGPMIGSSIASLGIGLSTIMIGGAILRLIGAVLVHYGLVPFTGKQADPIRTLGS